ncbi:hypothetical protein D3C87_2040530 [compost metagenome]
MTKNLTLVHLQESIESFFTFSDVQAHIGAAGLVVWKSKAHRIFRLKGKYFNRLVSHIVGV